MSIPQILLGLGILLIIASVVTYLINHKKISGKLLFTAIAVILLFCTLLFIGNSITF